MRAMILIALACLAGCSTLDPESIGVDESDNAVLCANVDLMPMWTNSRATYSRVELPKGYQLTPEQLAQLVAACSQ